MDRGKDGLGEKPPIQEAGSHTSGFPDGVDEEDGGKENNLQFYWAKGSALP